MPFGKQIRDDLWSLHANFHEFKGIEVEIRTYPHFQSLNFIH
jgi:hypothetical protein